jgi:hypothetical protein
MKLSQFTPLLVLGFLLLSFNSFAQKKRHHVEEKRRIDVIIEVNNRLVKGEMPELRIEINNNTAPKIETQYLPGHLFMSERDFKRLDTAKKFDLCFDNYSYKSKKLYITKFKVRISHAELEKPYLIVSCYDFNDRDYKRAYESATNKEFAVDLTYPGSTLLAKNK